MTKFMSRQSPIVSTSENALKRLISYSVAIGFVFLISLVFQILASGLSGLLSLGQLMIALSVSAGIIFLVKIINKKPTTAIDFLQPVTYALLTAMIMPRAAPFYVIIVCMILIFFFDWFFKILFKKNIIHPVLLSVLIIQMFFRDNIDIFETMGTIFQEQALGFGDITLPFGILSGLTIGGIAFIILAILWTYLSVAKILALQMSIWYAINVLWVMIVLSVFTNFTFWHLFNSLFLGYTVFTWVFFISEPTSTPETKEMMILYPAIAAFLMIWMKLRFDLVEAALYAIIGAQFISWGLEQFQQRTTPKRVILTYASVFTVWIVILVATLFS